jgi:hypothetical protein
MCFQTKYNNAYYFTLCLVNKISLFSLVIRNDKNTLIPLGQYLFIVQGDLNGYLNHLTSKKRPFLVLVNLMILGLVLFRGFIDGTTALLIVYNIQATFVVTIPFTVRVWFQNELEGLYS